LSGGIRGTVSDTLSGSVIGQSLCHDAGESLQRTCACVGVGSGGWATRWAGLCSWDRKDATKKGVYRTSGAIGIILANDASHASTGANRWRRGGNRTGCWSSLGRGRDEAGTGEKTRFIRNEWVFRSGFDTVSCRTSGISTVR